ncbi:glycosyltransferase family 4 protein [Thermococcus sp. AM4]|uniref:glycosyltransferase family 4 protein n=1 Tax=Thermococcus sp. (strain AM4) TaxID=246969 RepID=UPI00018710E5|nr:glycosyltransferase family 4 protein [Thermococcus sp. AM4]EEB73821.1 galactosyltransferase [Thermococcus sp. AM4]
METLRIAFVYDVIYPWVKGGVERRIYELARRLAKHHEVHVYGYRHWEGPKDIEREGVHYHGLAPSPKRLYLLGKRNPLSMLRLASRLRSRIGELREYDLVDVQNLFYPGALALKDLPNAVITWHEFWGPYWWRYLGPVGFPGWSTERALFSAERHVAVSWKTRLDLLKAGLRKPVPVVPNGVDVEFIRSVPPAELESDVIFAGRLIPEKGVDLLLRALAEVKREIPDVRVVIIGDGPERKRLERMAKGLGLEKNVLFTGFLSYENVIALMKASKVFVLPSKREGFGIVVLEAMASGLPVVTLDEPMNAAKFLVEKGKNGFVVGIEGISGVLKHFLEDGTLTKRVSYYNQGTLSRYEWSWITQNWLYHLGF